MVRHPFVQATGAGSKEQEAINFLEKKLKEKPQMNSDEAIQVMLLRKEEEEVVVPAAASLRLRCSFVASSSLLGVCIAPFVGGNSSST